MKIEKYSNFKKLTEEEVKEQAKKIFNFLHKLHPYLDCKAETFSKKGECIEFDNFAIELRALKRAKGESPVYCNFRLFRFAETELKRLESFLRKLN
ncbi:hypothetical protein, partial [Paraclostridium sordellii]|uniref:hypothetical protein n=1 Tax=Paraclostridium sordellii TaxID=1505 RepID=UPI000A7FD9B3